MGTLLNLKFARVRRKWGVHVFLYLPVFCLIMIGMQARIVSCSGGVNIPSRPYLFRDYGIMPPQAFTNSAQLVANLYQQKNSAPTQSSPVIHSASQYSDSEEVGSSEEEPPQYTAPLILDIDDPEVKARWMGFTGHDSSVEDEDLDDDEDEFEPGSISSSEFSSRSLAAQNSNNDGRSGLREDKNQEKKNNNERTASQTSQKNKGGGDQSRGMLDSFNIMNPLSGFWSGGDKSEVDSSAELPQSDEAPEYYYNPYAYDTYDPIEEEMQHNHKKPRPRPMGMPMPKPKHKHKHHSKPSRANPPKSMRDKRKKHAPYQDMGKPDRLSTISEKLSKLNPFNYVQIKAPQIKLRNNHDQRPSRRKRPPPLPSQGKSPKRPYSKKQPIPHTEEAAPEFEFYFGNPFDGFDADDAEDMKPQYDYKEEGSEEDEEENDQDEESDEEDDEENDFLSEGPMTIVHGEQEQSHDAPEASSEVEAHNDAPEALSEVEVETHDDTPEAFSEIETHDDVPEEAKRGEDTEPETTLVEDDEADYTTQGELPTSSVPDDKEKSISFKKVIGWRKRKRSRPKKHKKHKPARRPPNWKQYRPAPLLPEIPEGVHDAVLKVIKNVGFLPEYGKNEKYGGHNKIKGKFTKTRPITLHHGLLTEVLRR